MTTRIRAQIEDLEELLRQLRANPPDAATVMSIERLEGSIAVFRSMLDGQTQAS